MLLIKNADLYSPEHLGKCDVLVANGVIDGIFPADQSGARSEVLRSLDTDALVYDAQGMMTLPGIIDRHVHFSGAGGEGGPKYRTPSLQLSSFIKAGVTSAVGLLGTDGTCRSLRELLMKARALEDEGMSTWILTGSYRVPTTTLTGGIMDDLCLIDKVIGVKIALSDHRGSHPKVEAIREIVSDARTGGMLSGKTGFVCVHMGSEETSYEPLLRAIEKTDIPLSQFAPTHITRNEKLLKEGVSYAKYGGCLDITATLEGPSQFGVATVPAVKFLLSEGINSAQITLSSDGNGSMPSFDEAGKLTGVGIGPIGAVFNCMRAMIKDPELDSETIIALATSNVADQLGLQHKGRLKKGCDADILILDDDKNISDVFAKGKQMMEKRTLLKKGTFE